MKPRPLMAGATARRHAALCACMAALAVAVAGVATREARSEEARAPAGPATVLPSASARPALPQPASPQPDAVMLARGEYIAKASDCAGCHTAPQGGAPYAGGNGLGSPFGTIMSTNITPDPHYGIGQYTYDDFARVLRKGVARGGKRLYPAMPYNAFAKIDDADLHALYAYMMHGVAPVAKPNRKSDVSFPFNQRWGLWFWQLAFVPREPYQPHADRDAQWNRGAYLVQSVGHCGSCHTPRGIAYQERGTDESSSTFLTGGVNDHWFAPDLTGDAGSGLGRWRASEIAAFLKTGHGGGNIAYGSMVEQIEDSSQYLTDDDLLAIGRYLKSLPPRNPSATYAPHDDVARKPLNGSRVPEALSVGYNVYRSFCAQCHGGDGRGVPNVFPALAGNSSVLAEDTTSLIRLLVEGGNSPSTLTGPPRQQMPRFADTLADVQIGQVLTYIRSAWGNNAQPITANDVSSLRQKLHK
ncbi:cytochrome c family protein [Paraburkholderia xenovorans LB400]|uniref:Cytochrome c, class I n=1 Tax=Paraburkholderia xenovorans (strain LB400) TaxID=266265 RepID=Q13IJ3_PARXL|nr:cytochrome c [Paraburkholderia xenovorans]ABE36096.1 Putative cytochrome c, class I [Paraburkholderia xenovorans LB400]AIP34451.1 cytochrome c family protein [Paraburkholderia xenovorans LB400]